MAGRVYRYVTTSADVMRGGKQKPTLLTTATVRPHQGAPVNSCKLSGFRTHFESKKLTLRSTNSEEETSGMWVDPFHTDEMSRQCLPMKLPME